MVAVFTGADLAEHVTPYVGVLTHLAGLRSAPQHPIAVDVARWQGEPIAMVVAESRALAEDDIDVPVPTYRNHCDCAVEAGGRHRRGIEQVEQDLEADPDTATSRELILRATGDPPRRAS